MQIESMCLIDADSTFPVDHPCAGTPRSYCEHKCLGFEGGEVRCACFAGHSLHTDGRSCLSVLHLLRSNQSLVFAFGAFLTICCTLPAAKSTLQYFIVPIVSRELEYCGEHWWTEWLVACRGR